MDKIVGLVYDRLRWEEKVLAKEGRDNGLKVEMIDAKMLRLSSEDSFEEVKNTFGDIVLQRCISHYRGLHLTAYLENCGMDVINSFDVASICGNKFLTSLALKKKGVPTPKTFLAFTQEAALELLDEAGLPLVMKPVTGSWGRMVVPLRDRETAQAMIEMRAEMNNPLDHLFYIQEMVKRPGRDIRIIVVGGEVVVAVYRYAPDNEWRTNVARGGKSELCPIDRELEEIVLKAADAMGGGVLGVDAMESPEGIVVHEVNNTVEFKGAASVSETNIPKAIMEYVIHRMKR